MVDRPSPIAAGALAIAPLLLLTSTVLYALGDGFNNSAPGGAVQFWALVAFTVGLLGLVRRLEDHSISTAGWLTLLVVIGGAGGVGFGIDTQHAAINGATRLLDTGSIAPQVSLALAGALFPVSVIAVAIATGRAGLINRTAMVLAVVGAVLFPASRIPGIAVLGILADLVLVAALVPVGLAALRGRT
ncbi:MAG TPA: hypothetical protein VMM13_05655, partial [Euzebya sp.]|nr:hypothetical protein [Euzebya sp.]